MTADDPRTTQRVLGGVLGALLGAKAVGKVLDMRLHVVTLERFRALPKGVLPLVAYLWAAVELVAFAALPSRAPTASSGQSSDARGV